MTFTPALTAFYSCVESLHLEFLGFVEDTGSNELIIIKRCVNVVTSSFVPQLLSITLERITQVLRVCFLVCVSWCTNITAAVFPGVQTLQVGI